jgi:hypothetical protein
MPQYRIITIDFSGHRIGAKDVDCTDDQQAVQQALRSITINDVEVGSRTVLSRYCLDMKKPEAWPPHEASRDEQKRAAPPS